VTGSVTVWPPGREPLPPPAYSGRGRVPKRLRLGGAALPQHHPQSIKELALELGPVHWRTVTWREGTNAKLRSRFARVRVRPAHRDHLPEEVRPPEWLLIEWPKGDAEPLKYWRSMLPRKRRCSAWCMKPRCVGALSVTTGISSRTWDWGTTRAGAGGAFIITPA